MASPLRPRRAIPKVEQPVALPALVTIGRRDGNQLLLNLEAVGTLAVDGDDTSASDFVRSIVAELTTGEVLSDAFLVASGIDLDGFDGADRVQQHDRSGATDAIRAAVASSQAFLRQHAFVTMFESRLGGDAAGRESTIVVVDDEYAEPLDRGVVPGLGACLLFTGAVTDGTRVDLLESGMALLHPYGIEFEPAALPRQTLTAVNTLLDEASEPFEPAEPDHRDEGEQAAEPAADQAHASELGDDDDWEFPTPEAEQSRITRLTRGSRRVALGATFRDEQPGETWRVLLDPSGGHPSCLTMTGNW